MSPSDDYVLHPCCASLCLSSSEDRSQVSRAEVYSFENGELELCWIYQMKTYVLL